MTFLVHINGHSYAVGDAEVDHVEERILDATHAGGAFIEFEGPGGVPTRALVGPASWVRIEQLPAPEERSSGSDERADWAFFTDLDV